MKKHVIISTLACFALAACSSDAPEDTQSAATALSSSALKVSDRGVGKAGQHSFDLTAVGASATIVSLGVDAHIANDASFAFVPTPAWSPEGKIEATYRYDVGAPTVRRGAAVEDLGVVNRVERDGNRLEFSTPQARIRFDHGAMGLKHSVVLHQKMVGTGTLDVLMPVPSSFSHKAGDDIIQVFKPDGTYFFSWSGLSVFDANGKVLPAQMSATSDKLVITIDDSSAVYPLTVDPLASSPSWSTTGTVTGGQLGAAVAGGNLNGDAFDDLIVGQPRYTDDPANEAAEGRVLVFFGSAAGLSATADWAFESNAANTLLGTSIAAGNFNGDQYDDLLIGASLDSSVIFFAGAALVFDGSATGPGMASNWSANGDVPGAFFGDVVDTGDFNCDGFDDVVVGSSFYTTSTGRVWVYDGSAAGPGAVPWTRDGTVAGEEFGVDVAIGNFNGDTNAGNDCDDLAVGAPNFDTMAVLNAGRVSIFDGSTSGLPASPSDTYTSPRGTTLGAALAAGDVNGDGFDDLVVGEPRVDSTGLTDDGGIIAFYGSVTGLNTAATSFENRSGFNGSFAGSALAVGDVDGNGFADVLVGALLYASPEAEEGTAYLLSSNATGITDTRLFQFETNQANAHVGEAVAFLGDLTNDGYGDIAIGASAVPDVGGNAVGAAFVFYGEATCIIGGVVYAAGDENPANDCTVCDPNVSSSIWSTRPNGSMCDDGSLCTQGDTCQAGICTATTTTTCNDGNGCTVDSCDPGTGLCDFDSAAADGNTCTVPNQPACTTNICQTGVCTQDSITGCLIDGTCYAEGAMNPANPCETCNSATSQTAWANVSINTACDDDLFCTENTVCDGAGTCGGGTPRDCSGAAQECFDAVECSESSNACLPITPSAQGTACGGDLCTTNGMCDGLGTCSGTPVDCSGLDTVCEFGVCNLADGMCERTPRPDGTTCDDMDACTENTQCLAGSCSGGMAIVCDDMNGCTLDSCDPVAGCEFDAAAMNTMACDDGDACTETDVCTDGACDGAAVVCDDGDPCTNDACDSIIGCGFPTEPDGTICGDDGLSCTSQTCQAGACEFEQDAASCLIDDACYGGMVTNPANTCQICRPMAVNDAWSSADVGTPCALFQCSSDLKGEETGACDESGMCGGSGDVTACETGYLCSDATGRCNTECVSDDDCDGDSNYACNTATNVCELTAEPTCETDEDCSTDAPACNTDGVCVACTENSYCGDQVCVDESCVDCDTNDQCDGDLVCTDGRCSESTTAECSTNDDCGDDFACEGGMCVKVEGGGCGCASTGPTEDASWMLLAGMGLIGLMRRRR